MNIPFVDLKTQYTALKEDIQTRINTVLEHGQFVLGPEISELENQLCKYTGSQYCITAGSGTQALDLALRACNVNHGDEVITTPFTFFATIDSILNRGAKPVFVDIEPDTYNIDARLIEKAITNKTKAIIPVSLYGQTADMDTINTIAEAHQITVIEDAAQSFGATYKGKKSCNLSTIGVTSFFPAKPLGCYGDGGALFTNNKNIADLVTKLRVHGQSSRYYHTHLGTNARMDTLQAAILLSKLARFDWELSQRQDIAQKYNEAFAESSTITTPKIKQDRTCSWAQYTIRIKNRDDFQKAMAEKSIPTSIHYPTPVIEQPILEELYPNQKHQLDVCHQISQEVISLPIFPDATEEQITTVIQGVLGY